MTGLHLLLGVRKTQVNETYIQIAGHGWQISADDLEEVIRESRSLHTMMLRYVSSFLEQVSQTALANGRASIEQRLARWLLLADDRIEGSEIHLTHEFMGIMLGVQRTGVTVALRELEHVGGISQHRGHVNIIDRNALLTLASLHYTKVQTLH
jgi:CRP-like cAMP-binding protein